MNPESQQQIAVSTWCNLHLAGLTRDNKSDKGIAIILSAIERATEIQLTAERKKIENLHKILGRKRVTIKELQEQIEIDEQLQRHEKVLSETHEEHRIELARLKSDYTRELNAKLEQINAQSKTLLSALEAIEKKNAKLMELIQFHISGDPCHVLETVALQSDLSLLHEHVRKEQKPLVDALVKIRVQLDMEPQRLPLVERLQKYIADALAKVKQ